MRILSLLFACCTLVLTGCGDTNSTSSTAGTAAGNTTIVTAAVPGNYPVYNLDAASPESPDIRVTLKNAPLDGAILVGQFMERQFGAAETTVDGDAIVIRQSDPLPQGHYILYLKDKRGIQLLLSEDQTFTVSADMNNPVATIRVEGSEDNSLFYEALAYEAGQQDAFNSLSTQLQSLTPNTPEYEAVNAQRLELSDQRTAFLETLFERAPNSMFTSFKRAGQNPRLKEVRNPDGTMNEQGQVDLYRQEFWNNVNFGDERLLRTPVINNKLKRYMEELTPQNAQAIIAAADDLLERTGYRGKFYEFFANWITLKYEPGKTPVMDGEAIYAHMIQNYFTRERAVWSDSMTVFGLQQRADQMAHSLIGQVGPDITVPGLDGQGKRLFDSDKEYLAVFMYNPECDHCIEQTPKLKALYPSLKSELDIYAIALDTEDAKWRKFVQDYGLQDFTNVYDPTNRSIFKTYYVDNTPELYLLDKDRVIVAKNLKVNQLAEAIRLDKDKKSK